METKRVQVKMPSNTIASQMMPYVEKELYTERVLGWKVGGILHEPNPPVVDGFITKTVILYIG